MKKTVLMLIIASLLVLMMAGAAYAEGWYTSYEATHFNFSLTSEGCAGCHVTHVADAKYLLIAGPSQTDFCYACHAGFMASPYDVERGRIKSVDAGTTSNSTAGAFAFTNGNFFGSGNATSIHNVEAPNNPATADFAAADIPGNDTGNPLVGGFRCGSCHDPHAGDLPNDRLLRITPITGGGTVGDTTVTAVDFAYDGNLLVVTDYARVDAADNTNLNSWCGTCHGYFDVTDNAAKTLNNGKYRHAMGVAVDPTKTTLDAYLGVRDAAANSTKNYLNCLSCHFAHGSDKAKMDTYTTWTRDGGGSFTETDSTLLRMDKRGVCYDCHNAATDNLEGYGQSNS